MLKACHINNFASYEKSLPQRLDHIGAAQIFRDSPGF